MPSIIAYTLPWGVFTATLLSNVSMRHNIKYHNYLHPQAFTYFDISTQPYHFEFFGIESDLARRRKMTMCSAIISEQLISYYEYYIRPRHSLSS
jgi:hypothetical protein